MAQITEAACLLQSGNLYPQRNGFRTASNEDLFLGFKPGGFSIYFGDAPIYHFDLDGRWQRAYLNDRHYLKGLDTTTRTIERIREGANLILHRETLELEPARAVDEHIRRMALDLIEGLQNGRLLPVVGPESSRPIPTDRLGDFLGRIASWTVGDWDTLRSRYAGTYRSYPNLPPNGLNAVVLQATHGHSLGRAFGGDLPGVPAPVDLASFRSHCEGVRDLLGARLCQNRSIFLDGPDVLRLPVWEILDRMNVAREFFPTRPGIGPGKPSEFNPDQPEPRIEGFQIFLDEPENVVLSDADWKSLQSNHLREVVVGLVSGDPETRSCFGSSWSNEDFERLVAAIKRASVKLTVLTLVGPSRSDAHAGATLDLLERLPLDREDLIALVDAADFDRTGLLARIGGLSPTELEAQRQEFQTRLIAHRKEKGVKFAPYSTEKQWL